MYGSLRELSKFFLRGLSQNIIQGLQNNGLDPYFSLGNLLQEGQKE